MGLGKDKEAPAKAEAHETKSSESFIAVESITAEQRLAAGDDTGHKGGASKTAGRQGEPASEILGGPAGQIEKL